MWEWGDNLEGQLGVLSVEAKTSEPIKVPLSAGHGAIAVSGGDRHSLVLLDNHTVLVFGKCLYLGSRRNQASRRGSLTSSASGPIAGTYGYQSYSSRMETCGRFKR